MADITRADRVLQLFALLISNPSRSYSVSDLMEALEIPENERRNVQRDMQSLTSANGGAYIRVISDQRAFRYQSAIKSADNLLFPNFENTMLHFVFLKRIANIYPATSEIISQLLERIEKSLPHSEQKSLQILGKELNTKILFMGAPPDFEEDSSEKIRTILRAIHERRKIDVTYKTEEGERQSIRIPLMIIIYEDDLYVGCQRQDGDTYTLKFRRIKNVKLLKDSFEENPNALDKLRKQVASGAAFMGSQEPKLEDVEIEFKSRASLYLEENLFNRSMRIGKPKNGKVTVKLKAEVNQLLFNWIVSFTDAARVVKPVSLRNRLRTYAKYLLENYGE